jgi:hypothetical protein
VVPTRPGNGDCASGRPSAPLLSGQAVAARALHPCGLTMVVVSTWSVATPAREKGTARDKGVPRQKRVDLRSHRLRRGDQGAARQSRARRRSGSPRAPGVARQARPQEQGHRPSVSTLARAARNDEGLARGFSVSSLGRRSKGARKAVSRARPTGRRSLRNPRLVAA